MIMIIFLLYSNTVKKKIKKASTAISSLHGDPRISRIHLNSHSESSFQLYSLLDVRDDPNMESVKTSQVPSGVSHTLLCRHDPSSQSEWNLSSLTLLALRSPFSKRSGLGALTVSLNAF